MDFQLPEEVTRQARRARRLIEAPIKPLEREHGKNATQ